MKPEEIVIWVIIGVVIGVVACAFAIAAWFMRQQWW